MAVKPIPDEYHSVQPYLVVDGAVKLIEFLKGTFDVEEPMAMPRPDGKIGHAEVRIGDSVVMLADSGGPNDAQPTSAMLVVYVEDVDKIYRRALEAGGESIQEPEDQFYGDRSAGVRDSFGNQWYIHTHVEDVPPEEMAKRAEEAAAQHG
jgi:PhnB protein